MAENYNAIDFTNVVSNRTGYSSTEVKEIFPYVWEPDISTKPLETKNPS